MTKCNCTFSILITTKNRLPDLIFTLEKLASLLTKPYFEVLICDDGSTDGTFDYVQKHFPNVIIFRNETSKGLIFSRNVLLEKTTAKYAISLDDDAHFLSQNPLEEIQQFFEINPTCGVLAFRIYWDKNSPITTQTNEKSIRVKGFVGCGHAWRMSAWRSIPNYPSWFVFYGEEDFAAYQLFKKEIEIHYLPSVLVHHRVDILSRKSNQDYQLRLRRSFRSGWYLYFMFYPI